MDFGVGRTTFVLQTVVSIQKKYLCVQLVILDPNSKPHFHALEADKDAIEHELGAKLRWHELPEKKSSYITINDYGRDPADRADWDNQHEWILKWLEAFQRCFSPRVKAIGVVSATYQAMGWSLRCKRVAVIICRRSQTRPHEQFHRICRRRSCARLAARTGLYGRVWADDRARGSLGRTHGAQRGAAARAAGGGAGAAESGAAAGGAGGGAAQARQPGPAVAGGEQPRGAPAAGRRRDGGVPAGGRVDRRGAGAGDRLRRARQQRLAGGEPVYGDREPPQPAAGRGDLCQRAAAGGDRAEERGGRERHDLERL